MPRRLAQRPAPRRAVQDHDAKVVPPSSLEGIEKYLGSGMVKGIGPHFAKVLVKAFGEKVFGVIEDEPERMLELCSRPPTASRELTGERDSGGSVMPSVEPNKTEAAPGDGFGCSFHTWWLRLMSLYSTVPTPSISSDKMSRIYPVSTCMRD